MQARMQQLQAEGACLRYPEPLGTHQSLSMETVLSMLLKAIPLTQQVPFVWGWIDKPQDGSVYMIYMPNPERFPNDGIRWQDGETKTVIPAGQGRDLELCEVKYGFVPNSGEQVALRARRRYRLARGGHVGIGLVHYSRGPPMPINPAFNQPVRPYPLRPINEPSIFVCMGDKFGHQVYPPGTGPPAGGVNYAGGIAIPPGTNQQALLAQQRARMEGLEAKRQLDGNAAAAAAAANAAKAAAQAQLQDEDSGDEGDQISTRALALARYRRNHELMNEVFMYAAFGEKKAPPRPPSYSTLFNKTELDEKTTKLFAEIEELKQKEVTPRPLEGDVSMDSEAMSIS
ncbi:hypothetical protein NEOLEDRAFT_1180554 [Neolentinus lepideus HHB14362 ss-1]|uniref:SWI/SNF and RSC complexes subunit Ssr4 N-terminal domain-containing protein n=1 Tax=Neolentinus lepideus HHB14362 ss-1 TaxID=1314782 RepID=A0A165QS76_9AGAM|nr:hypothetical protein NEOLEDRAFT_1180554 [Neolentinus lepideus HHB14362 ss-1]